MGGKQCKPVNPEVIDRKLRFFWQHYFSLLFLLHKKATEKQKNTCEASSLVADRRDCSDFVGTEDDRALGGRTKSTWRWCNFPNQEPHVGVFVWLAHFTEKEAKRVRIRMICKHVFFRYCSVMVNSIAIIVEISLHCTTVLLLFFCNICLQYILCIWACSSSVSVQYFTKGPILQLNIHCYSVWAGPHIHIRFDVLLSPASTY